MFPTTTALRALVVLGVLGGLARTAGADADAFGANLKAISPGLEHIVLAARAGKWTSTIKTWTIDPFLGPMGSPSVSQGTHELTMVAGGRFLREEVRVNHNGIIYEGIGYTGFDNLQKKFVSVWMDNDSTAMRFSTGTAEGKNLSLTPEPANGYRWTWKMSGDDKMVVEIFRPSGHGKEVTFREISYQRAK